MPGKVYPPEVVNIIRHLNDFDRMRLLSHYNNYNPRRDIAPHLARTSRNYMQAPSAEQLLKVDPLNFRESLDKIFPISSYFKKAGNPCNYYKVGSTVIDSVLLNNSDNFKFPDKTSDLKTTDKTSDLKATDKTSDLKVTDKASDLKITDKTGDLKATDNASGLKVTDKTSDLQVYNKYN